MIIVAGVSHKTAPLALREALAFPAETLPGRIAELQARAGVPEAVILSTCNRVELYAFEGEQPAGEMLLAFLAETHGRSPDDLRASSYVLSGDEAVRHAFRVAASLESMVVGESQILGQVKQAYQVAEEAGALGPTLSTLRNRILATAKRVRTETGIGRNAVSVSHVAVELVHKIFEDLAGKHVVLVGAGKMSELAARRLLRSGATASVVGGRTMARAEALAESLGGSAVPLERLRDEIARADVVICSTAAPNPVVTRDDVLHARASRRQRPLVIIDIAVPRDVEESVKGVEGIFLYDMDALKSVAAANLEGRLREAQAAEALVTREVEEFLGWQRSLDAVPLLVELRRRGENVRRAELDKLRKRLGPLTMEQSEAIEASTTAIVNKLLHSPTVYLKELARADHSPADMEAVRRLLGL
jgi:glutamyl-tRNA reductase